MKQRKPTREEAITNLRNEYEPTEKEIEQEMREGVIYGDPLVELKRENKRK